MQTNCSFLLLRKIKHICINTDLKLEINNVSATVYHKLSLHWKVRNIAKHLEERT